MESPLLIGVELMHYKTARVEVKSFSARVEEFFATGIPASHGAAFSHHRAMLSDIRSVHFVGICGTAMASAAAAMQERGFRVTGSDANVYPPMSTFLAERKVEVISGYDEKNLAHKPDLVVIGNAMSRGNPEVEWLLDTRALPFTSLPAFLAELVLKGRRTIVVAGQLGKPIQTFTGPQMKDILNIKKSLGFVDPRYGMKECELCDSGEWRPGATCQVQGSSENVVGFDEEAEKAVQAITAAIRTAGIVDRRPSASRIPTSNSS